MKGLIEFEFRRMADRTVYEKIEVTIDDPSRVIMLPPPPIEGRFSYRHTVEVDRLDKKVYITKIEGSKRRSTPETTWFFLLFGIEIKAICEQQLSKAEAHLRDSGVKQCSSAVVVDIPEKTLDQVSCMLWGYYEDRLG